MTTSWIEELCKDYQASKEKDEMAEETDQEKKIHEEALDILDSYLPILFIELHNAFPTRDTLELCFSTDLLWCFIPINEKREFRRTRAPYLFESMKKAAEKAEEHYHGRIKGRYEPPINNEDAEKIIFELKLS